MKVRDAEGLRNTLLRMRAELASAIPQAVGHALNQPAEMRAAFVASYLEIRIAGAMSTIDNALAGYFAGKPRSVTP